MGNWEKKHTFTYTSIVLSLFQEPCPLKRNFLFSLSFPFCVYFLFISPHFSSSFFPPPPYFSLHPFLPFLNLVAREIILPTASSLKLWNMSLNLIFFLNKKETLLKHEHTFGQNSTFVIVLRKYRKSPLSPNSAEFNSFISNRAWTEVIFPLLYSLKLET